MFFSISAHHCLDLQTGLALPAALLQIHAEGRGCRSEVEKDIAPRPALRPRPLRPGADRQQPDDRPREVDFKSVVVSSRSSRGGPTGGTASGRWLSGVVATVSRPLETNVRDRAGCSVGKDGSGKGYLGPRRPTSSAACVHENACACRCAHACSSRPHQRDPPIDARAMGAGPVCVRASDRRTGEAA